MFSCIWSCTFVVFISIFLIFCRVCGHLLGKHMIMILHHTHWHTEIWRPSTNVVSGGQIHRRLWKMHVVFQLSPCWMSNHLHVFVYYMHRLQICCPGVQASQCSFLECLRSQGLFLLPVSFLGVLLSLHIDTICANRLSAGPWSCIGSGDSLLG